MNKMNIFKEYTCFASWHALCGEFKSHSKTQKSSVSPSRTGVGAKSISEIY